MRPRISVFIATSLDGYIARRDGSVDWLGAPASDPAEDYGFAKFMTTVDLLVIGRVSFETALEFDTWPYVGTRVLVLSSRPVPIPLQLLDIVSSDSGPPGELVKRDPMAESRHIHVDGGITVQRFVSAGLVDEVTITWVPVLLGEGRPLFGVTGHDVSLDLQRTRSWSNGYVQSAYKVRHDH